MYTDYILWTRMNLKIPIRKVSLAYNDFVNEKIVEIEKKVGNWGRSQLE